MNIWLSDLKPFLIEFHKFFHYQKWDLNVLIFDQGRIFKKIQGGAKFEMRLEFVIFGARSAPKNFLGPPLAEFGPPLEKFLGGGQGGGANFDLM